MEGVIWKKPVEGAFNTAQYCYLGRKKQKREVYRDTATKDKGSSSDRKEEMK